MVPFIHPILFSESAAIQTKGRLELDEPLAYHFNTGGSGFYRPGRLRLDNGAGLELVLYHNSATASFIYLRRSRVDLNLLEFMGLDPSEIGESDSLVLPGQLCLGSERTKIIGEAIHGLLESPALRPIFLANRQQNLAIFPIAREGLKYQVAEAIFAGYGYYCDEIVLDAHHVFDSSIPVYNRSVEFTLFKDKDLDRQQKENIKVAFIADSIASGLVMKEVIARVKERFENLQQVEVIAPLATVRGLCRIAQAEISRNVRVRVHIFETILNALPPDFYYSAHIPIPEFHICPDLEAAYRAWWGQDKDGHFIADTACAGYGWSEVFYSPRKQIQMMNSELGSRHGLTIAQIVRRQFPA